MNIKTISSTKHGFTLAEVLITLLIIGIVASIVIPALIQDTQDAQYKVAMRQKYAVFSQALMRIRMDNGNTLEGLFEQGNAYSIFEPIKKPLNVVSYSLTETTTTNADWHDYCNFKYLNGDPGTDAYKCIDCTSYTLADGSVFMPLLDWTTNNINTCEQTGSHPRSGLCFNIMYDINGKKAPNVMGKDIFLLAVYKNKTVPADWGPSGSIDASSCTSSGSGVGCAIQYILQ